MINTNPEVIIDPGHGGVDPGMISKLFLEKDINLKISLYQFNRFKELNVPVALTRDKDTTIEPVVRGSIVKNSGAKLCISNHVNSFTKASVRGAEVIHSIYSNGKLANLIMDNLVEAGAIKRRVFSREHDTLKGKDHYYMHRYTGKVETVISEYGFGTNEEDALFIVNNLEKLGEAVVKAVCLYLGYKYTTPIKNEVKVLLMKKGSKGNDVFNLQSKLSKLNYNVGPIDGIYGNKTVEGVKSFQKDSKIGVDGIAGPKTLSKLDEVFSKFKDNPIVNKKPYKLLRRYDSDIYIFETVKKNHVDVDLGKKNKLEKLSTIVTNHLKEGKKVLCAINCGFFNFDGSSEHLGMFIDEGLYYTPPSKSFIDFIYYKDGTTEIVNLHGYDPKTLVNFQRNSHWAIGTSYSLIQKGTINLENSSAFSHSKERHPRALFGQRKDGSFVLVVVDGRRINSRGVNAKESAEIMLELGCYNAVNFDGGGSATMVVVIDGKAIVVNNPSNIGGSERGIGSCMLVLEE